MARPLRIEKPGGTVVERELQRVFQPSPWAQRPPFEAVIGLFEKVKGRQWADFRGQYGDTGGKQGRSATPVPIVSLQQTMIKGRPTGKSMAVKSFA
jgi:hypothetical protein